MAQLVRYDIAGYVGERERWYMISADSNEASSITQERAGEGNEISIR